MNTFEDTKAWNLPVVDSDGIHGHPVTVVRFSNYFGSTPRELLR